MKKRHFLAIFVTIAAAVAIGMGFSTFYDSAMLSVTGDCRYWHPNGPVDLSDAQALDSMSLDETKCALKNHADDLKRKNDGL